MDTSWCKDIYTSIEDNSSWKTSIFFPTSLFSVYNLTGIKSTISIDDESSSTHSNECMEIETDIEVDVAKAMKTEIEVDIESNFNTVQTENDIITSKTLDVIDIDIHNNSSIQISSSVPNKNYTTPNIKHDIDILLFLNPSLLIQSQINTIWIKNNYPDNTCFLFEGY